MQKHADKITYALLLCGLLFFTFFAIYSEGTWGGADNYVHYRISRFSWQKPILFLDLWGKPLFNILSSPFSQFGFPGIKFFNVTVAIVTAALAYDLTKIFKWKNNFVVVPMLLFTPIYFIVVPSALTEPLFGLVLLFAIWLFFRNRLLLSALIISFIPFARNEGFVLFPLFIAAYILKREYKAIPLVFTGFLTFSLIGLMVYNNFLWVFDEFFGPGGKGVYGTGEMLYYVKEMDQILGFPVLILWFVGFVAATIALLKQFKKINFEHYFYILIVGAFITFFLAHTVVWWLIDGPSLGLIRVLASVAPVTAIVATRGVHQVSVLSQKRKPIQFIFVAISAITIILFPFFKFDVPLKIGEAEKVIKVCCDWVEEENLDENLIYFYDPLIPHYLGKNPYDADEVNEIVDDKVNPENGMPQNAIVIWDAHFGPNEGGLPLERLMDNPSFTLLKKFSPKHPFTVLNGYTYEIYIFKRL